MSSKVWSIGLQKHTKMIQYHVHIRSFEDNKIDDNIPNVCPPVYMYIFIYILIRLYLLQCFRLSTYSLRN